MSLEENKAIIRRLTEAENKKDLTIGVHMGEKYGVLNVLSELFFDGMLRKRFHRPNGNTVYFLNIIDNSSI